MRLRYGLVTVLFALCCAERVDSRLALRVRQANDPATTTDDSPSSTADSNSPLTTSPSSTDSASPSSTNEGKDSSTVTDGGSQNAHSTIRAITLSSDGNGFPTAVPTSISHANSTSHGHVLPIQPRLNPAIGVGGVVLIIAGLGLAFVGIKHRATQTFLSTALLVALGIEVLVVYLMHPPVPVAVQAAYLIAGVLGGGLLGGVALVFKEVSEGFGCVLGGFCFAMWLLVLSPGGTIKSSTRKIVLIAVFCVAGYCTYISRFTRVYGVIFCTAFAGSTAFILGIDFFSRAGLKEFWIYIWNINDNEFPLFTTSYPITRNMRAEIAAIVIVAFLGTMSQIKIWKIVKEQRAKRDAERIEDEEARDVLDEEVGRRLENRNRKSLATWQGYYDGKKQAEVHVDSGIGSIDEDYGRERSHSDFDGSSKHDKKGLSFPLASLRPAKGEGDRPDDKRRSSGSYLSQNFTRASAAPSIPSFAFGSDNDEIDLTSFKATSVQASEPTTPGLSVPEPSVKDRRGISVKRLSLKSLKRNETLKTLESPGTPYIEEDDEDVASSIAATAAEAPDMDALSVRLSRPNSTFFSYAAGSSAPQSSEQLVIEDDEEVLLKQGSILNRPRAPRSPGLSSLLKRSSGISQGTPGETGEQAQQTELAERLPKKISKAALKYRTNEWAKEVSTAEPEPIEETLQHDPEAVQVEMGDAAEAARAEENNAAPAPPPAPVPVPAPASASASRSKQENRKSDPRPHLLRNSSSQTLTPVYSHNSKPSNDSWSIPLAHRVSTPMLTVGLQPAVDGSRNISEPTVKPQAVDSPADNVPSKLERSASAISMSRQSNLLDERKDRVENRLTTTSFMSLKPTSTTSDTSGEGDLSRQGSQTDLNATIPEEAEDDDEMTLAARKVLVQNGILAPEVTRRTSQLPPLTASTQSAATAARTRTPSRSRPALMASASHQKSIRDSHQPRRSSSHDPLKQAQNWSAWRNSSAMASQSQNALVSPDDQMEIMRAARAQADHEARAREQRKRETQATIDQHMRMGGMNDRHRNALKKMQGMVEKGEKERQS